MTTHFIAVQNMDSVSRVLVPPEAEPTPFGVSGFEWLRLFAHHPLTGSGRWDTERWSVSEETTGYGVGAFQTYRDYACAVDATVKRLLERTPEQLALARAAVEGR